ncbi:hypothetical protein DCAR_0314173 [Daucus carota subsp. sativus]|uniref:Uncharacterized protein n=1 Tax=Daucus carota subsp. sativus TaxID=79200 RepID=A0A161WYG1_DAUCS|nr:PREDICTED: uncharacterized protein LOC108211095 [Daucus carota subsp. sativus]WOG94876.1 hypothetical protein DCAR_0314173 [Daucus carota subsp. sativus]
MPFPLKIQPVDFNSPVDSAFSKPVKSRFKRLFENVLRSSAPEKAVTDAGTGVTKDISDEFEPSSVCLANMVLNFIEESNDKTTSVKCSKSRCYCFTGDRSDCDDDDVDSNACELLKSLVMCASVFERNLLADASRIVEKNKIFECKDNSSRKLVTDGLLALGYDASICKARWEKAPSYPAGEYEYIDVIREEERLIVDIDFRSEFEIARSTKTYNRILETLPVIFVGKDDRLQKIIYLVSEAARQSLRKKGMPFPPWRKADYVKSKWLSPYTRTPPPTPSPSPPPLTLENPTDLTTDSLIPMIRHKNPFSTMNEGADSRLRITPSSTVNEGADPRSRITPSSIVNEGADSQTMITPSSTVNEGANSKTVNEDADSKTKITRSSAVNEGADSPNSSDHGGDTVFTMSEDDEDN